MKIMFVMLLLFAATQPLAIASETDLQLESRSATVYLSNEGDYPVTLFNADESSYYWDGYLYKNQPVHWNMGGHFEKPMFICFTFKQTPDSLHGVNGIRIHAVTPRQYALYIGGDWNNQEDFEVCSDYEENYQNDDSFSEWLIDIQGEKSDGKHYTGEGVQIDNITVTFKGFGWKQTP